MRKPTHADETARSRGVGPTGALIPPVLPSLHGAALGQLDYIRRAIQSSQHLTCVSGRGGIAMGVIGLAAGGLSALPSMRADWLAVWLGAAAASILVGGWFMLRKARAQGVLLTRGVARRFLHGIGPAIVAGGAITAAMIQRHGLAGQGLEESVLPGVWLLFYGIGVLTGGATSVRSLPVMGASFLALSVLTFIAPSLALLALTLGFGLLHVVFGVILERNDG